MMKNPVEEIKKWDLSGFSKEFNIDHYRKDTFPFRNMFFDNHYHTMSAFNAYKRVPKEVCNSYLRRRAEYLLDICDFYVLSDVNDPQTVYSYYAFRLDDKKPVVYFAYTKNMFRSRGMMHYLMEHSLNLKNYYDFKVSCPTDLSKIKWDAVRTAYFL